MKTGDLKVWWIPQIPMKQFEVPVKSPKEAVLILDTLARYDTFQLENNIKPDYCNAGGLIVFEDGEWTEWYSKEGETIEEWEASQAEIVEPELVNQKSTVTKTGEECEFDCEKYGVELIVGRPIGNCGKCPNTPPF